MGDFGKMINHVSLGSLDIMVQEIPPYELKIGEKIRVVIGSFLTNKKNHISNYFIYLFIFQ